MDICVDFDGTCVTHEFPRIGKDIGAVPVLKELVANGHNLILFTMRSDVDAPKSDNPEIVSEPGQYLSDAINWFKDNNIPLYGIQSNPTQKEWTTSPKAYGQIYIDDAALGCPLVREPYTRERPYVSWPHVRQYFIESGLIRTE